MVLPCRAPPVIPSARRAAVSGRSRPWRWLGVGVVGASAVTLASGTPLVVAGGGGGGSPVEGADGGCGRRRRPEWRSGWPPHAAVRLQRDGVVGRDERWRRRVGRHRRASAHRRRTSRRWWWWEHVDLRRRLGRGTGRWDRRQRHRAKRWRRWWRGDGLHHHDERAPNGGNGGTGTGQAGATPVPGGPGDNNGGNGGIGTTANNRVFTSSPRLGAAAGSVSAPAAAAAWVPAAGPATAVAALARPWRREPAAPRSAEARAVHQHQHPQRRRPGHDHVRPDHRRLTGHRRRSPGRRVHRVFRRRCRSRASGGRVEQQRVRPLIGPLASNPARNGRRNTSGLSSASPQSSTTAPRHTSENRAACGARRRFATMELCRVTSDGFELKRARRSRSCGSAALAGHTDAFAQTLATVQERTDADWAANTTRWASSSTSACFFAEEDGENVGMGGVFVINGRAELVAVWTRRNARR